MKVTRILVLAEPHSERNRSWRGSKDESDLPMGIGKTQSHIKIIYKCFQIKKINFREIDEA